jgi:hypothetical protein
MNCPFGNVNKKVPKTGIAPWGRLPLASLSLFYDKPSSKPVIRFFL